MAKWPAALPNLHMTDSLDSLPQTINTEMEGGNEVTRRITTAEIDTASITLRFDDNEIYIFRHWFNTRDGGAVIPPLDPLEGGASGGAAWFQAKLLTGYGWGDASHEGIYRDCKIVGGYKMKHIGMNWWDVSFTFKVRYA